MIENLRKYTGLIIVLFVLVIIGFFFMDASTMRASSGGSPYLKISGRTYSDSEFRKLGESSFEVTQSLMQPSRFQFDFEIVEFIRTLAGNTAFAGDAQSDSIATEKFFVNRILLQSAKKEFGIYPGDDEIDSFIRQLRAFTGPDGAFSQEIYRDFIEKRIGRLGLTEGDIRSLASDILAQRKLTEILGAGLTTDRGIVAKSVAIANQRIGVDLTHIDIAPIKEKIDPSEDEIKTYWETIQDAFKTPEKRSFVYLTAKPTIPEEPAEIAPLAADATEEQKAEHETKVANREAEIAEARRLAQLTTDEKVDDFLYKLESQKELNFDELAKKDGWELKTTELFAQNEAPADLGASLRSSSSQGTAADELFRMNITSDPFSKISPAIPVKDNEWIVARLEEIEESRTQTYEEARDEARAYLIAEKAAAALKTAVDEAITKIQASLAEGKDFAEATKAAGIENEIVSLPEVTSSFEPDTAKTPANIFDAIKYTDPGKIAEPVIEPDRAFIIHVKNREVVKTPEYDSIIDSQMEQATDGNKSSAFISWLEAKNEAADVQQLYRQ